MDSSTIVSEEPDPPSTTQSEIDRENGVEEETQEEPKQTRRRGRQANDPLGQSITFTCQRVEDLESQLRDYLNNPTGDPEHTTLQFSFSLTTAFMISARETLVPASTGKKAAYTYNAFKKTAVSAIDALSTNKDPKDQVQMQKGISRTLVEAVQEADGFRYSFHNQWVSREDQASRFSYFCNDSTLNKGRAANEGAEKARLGVKIRKPVFDCRGLLSVKFSVTKMSLELHYKHIPLHPTFEARAPPPRKDSKRRRLLEVFYPEKLPKPREKKRKATPPPKNPSKRRRGAPGVAIPPENESTAVSARDNSLQPLFDFLGSAGRLEEERPGIASSEGNEGNEGMASHNSEAGPHVSSRDHVPQPQDGTALEMRKPRKGKSTALPGMMSGFMSDDQLTWGLKKHARLAKRGQRAKQQETPAVSIPPSLSPALVPASNVPPVREEIQSVTELEALKARLLEAEQKIRDLETEKSRAAMPITWNSARPPPPPPQPPVSNQAGLHPHMAPATYMYQPPQLPHSGDYASPAPRPPEYHPAGYYPGYHPPGYQPPTGYPAPAPMPLPPIRFSASAPPNPTPATDHVSGKSNATAYRFLTQPPSGGAKSQPKASKRTSLDRSGPPVPTAPGV